MYSRVFNRIQEMSYTNRNYSNKKVLLVSRNFVAVCFSVLFMMLINLLVSVDTFAASINISLDNSTISVDATGFNAIGDFYSSNNTTVSVTTDNESGYTLSILGNNGTLDFQCVATDIQQALQYAEQTFAVAFVYITQTRQVNCHNTDRASLFSRSKQSTTAFQQFTNVQT